MSVAATSYATVAIASDAGVAAAAELDRFLASLVASTTIEEPDREIWRALDSHGWTASGEPLHLLDLVELAIVGGRFLTPAPFLTTFLARRYMAPGVPPATFG